MRQLQAKGAVADSTPQVSVVVPLFNEAENLPELYCRLSDALDSLGGNHELILVDDGSSDSTPHLLRDLQHQDSRVIAVYLSRNFGHQAALCAGIDQARGAAVVLMDGDLQDPPEVLGDLLARWREGYEVVYAVRTQRKEGPAKRLGYFLFYRLLRAISDLDIPLDSGDFCLMDRKVVDVLCRLPEQMRFVRGLRTFVGFRQVGVPYERAARNAGLPKYTFRALVRLAVDGLISFSSYPLSLVTYLGLTSALVAVALTLWVAGATLVDPHTPRGWGSTNIVVLFTSAVQLLCLGLLGEYVRRIFVETKGRPTYIVREVLTAASRPDTLPFRTLDPPPPRRHAA